MPIGWCRPFPSKSLGLHRPSGIPSFSGTAKSQTTGAISFDFFFVGEHELPMPKSLHTLILFSFAIFLVGCTTNSGLPSVTPPSISVPEISVPDVSVPDVSVPDVSVPEISVPDVSVPEVSIPEVSLPDVSLPDVSVPELSVPKIDVPDVSIPPVTIP